jgi:hypothetical protein
VTTRSTPLAVIAAAVAVVLLNACGSPGRHTTSRAAASRAAASADAQGAAPPVSASSTGNKTVNACSLISGAEVNQVMGQSFPSPTPTNVGTFDDCRTEQPTVPYSCTTSCPPAAIPVSLAWAAVPTTIDRSEFATNRALQQSPQDVAGLGDQAFCSNNAVYVLKGTTELQVFADTCAHAEALARIALGRL